MQPNASPWLHEEVARRMEQRLEWIVAQPQTWVHWEPLRGGLQAHSLIARRYPKSRSFLLPALTGQAGKAIKSVVKTSLAWWNPARWTAAPVHYGAPPQPVNMLWANMALHMAADPRALLAQWHELLASDGFVMFSCLGPRTLRALHAVYAAHGWPAPTHAFTDMHDWGDMLVQAGFADPVMDTEQLYLTFATPQRLLTELRELGRNLHPQRFAALRGRGWLQQLHTALQAHLCDPTEEGRLKLDFEIIYGHAIKPTARMVVQAQSHISLQQMRTTLGLVRKP
jgi:malonyl-CoA O-methyltransferase